MREREMVYGPDQAAWTLHYGLEEFQAFADGVPKDYSDNGVLDEAPCEKKGTTQCCRGGARGDSGYTMSHACFSMIGGVPFISEIEFDPGSI
jgi:hypothetical protein